MSLAVQTRLLRTGQDSVGWSRAKRANPTQIRWGTRSFSLLSERKEKEWVQIKACIYKKIQYSKIKKL